jgi:F-type H+-transporting ATPase subunit a
MDFSNNNLWVLFTWKGTTVYVTQTLLSTWIVMGVLLLLAVIVRLRLSSFKTVPGRAQNVIEALVETMANFTKSTMGEGFEGFGGYFFGIFAFILLSNYSGLVRLRPPTADLAVTFALGLATFLVIHITGIRRRKWGYLKSFIEPNPVFLPINLISEISQPISLGFRLFGNMLGSVVIVNLVYYMLPWFLRFIFPDILHAYFDIFAGALQAFIFTVLSMTFIKQKAVSSF